MRSCMAFASCFWRPVSKLFNLVVRIVADGVDLRAEVFAGDCWILVEQRLNPVVVLLLSWCS
jgi:hypothetical protein